MPNLYLPKVKLLAEALRVDTDASDDRQTVLVKVIAKLRLLQHKTGLPADFTKYNLSEEDLELVADAVKKDPASEL